MSKIRKIVVILVCVLAFVGVALGGVLAIVNNKGSSGGDIQRTERLDTPKNVVVDDSWVLHWSAVDGAVGYNVIIDGSSTSVFAQSNKLDVSAYAKPGNHSFKVQARHSTLPQFHSLYSSLCYKEKSVTLQTPGWATFSSTLFSWGAVSEASSYYLRITATNETPVEQYYKTTEFDLSKYIATHPNVNSFTIEVRATSYNIDNNTLNTYIHDSESVYRTYVKTSAITAPTLSANFASNAKTMKGDLRTITWNVGEYVSAYEIWLDGEKIDTISRAQIGDNTQYSLDLTYQKSDTVGAHSIYVVAVPEVVEGLALEQKQSNTLYYSVNQKLDAVDASTIQISMDALTLNMSWAGNSLASKYTIELRGKAGNSTQYTTFAPVEQNSGNSYSMTFDTDFAYQFVSARVMACAQAGHTYIQDADYSAWSADCSVVTELSPLSSVNVAEDESENIIVTIADNEQNAQFGEYIDSYFCTVYEATQVDGVYTRGEWKFGVNIPYGTTSFNLSDYLRDRNCGAGSYSLVVKTLAKSQYRNFFATSEPTDEQFFAYKSRLSMPTGVGCTRIFADGASTVRFVFNGVQGASGYRLTITKGETLVGTVEFTQPANYLNEQFVDETQVQSLIGDAVEPCEYKFSLVALAPTDSGASVTDSRAFEYTYTDIFKHEAVEAESIAFTQNGNSVVASWGAVSTATAYNIKINGISITVNGVSTDITSWLNLGDNTFAISCQATPAKYDESDTVSVTYSYTYAITGTAEIEYKLVEVDGVNFVEISIPHFDSKVTSYAIQFGGNAPIALSDDNFDATSGKVVYRATMTGAGAELPLYETTEVKIYAGATVSDSNLTVQPYITEYKVISKSITNDLAIDAPTMRVTDGQLKFNFVEKSLKFTQKVEYNISLNGRSLYNGTIARSELFDDENAQNVPTNGEISYSLAELIYQDASASLSAGTYVISATVYSTSGLQESASCEYIKQDKLGTVTNFVHATDNSYLQWDAVYGADDYTVAVTFGGETVSGVSMALGAYIDGGKSVMRLNTIGLFGTYGVGVYNFTITATCEDANIKDADAVTHEWTLATTLVDPIFTIETYNGEVCAKILKNPLADSYTVTVNGNSISANRDTSSNIYQYVDLGIDLAGKYEIAVQAVRTSGEVSATVTQNYVNILKATAPTGADATQDLEQSTITLTTDLMTTQIVNGTAGEITATLGVEAQISTLDKVYFEKTIALTQNGEKMTAVLDEDAKSWLNSQSGTTFLVYFRTVAYTDSSISGDAILTASEVSLARLSFQRQLEMPSFTLNGTVVSSVSPVVMTVQNATTIDVMFEKVGDSSWSKLLSAQNVSSGSFEITSAMLDNTRGTYNVQIRATNNGIYVASKWANAQTITCATALGNVTNIQFSRNSTDSTLTLTFDALDKATSYSAKLSVSGVVGEFNLGTVTASSSKVTLTYDYSSNTTLTNALAGKPTLTFVITATPSEADANLYLASETTFVYTIGTVSAPQNFVFNKATFGSSVNVTWTGDANYSSENGYSTSYAYSLVIKDGASNAVSSTTTTGTVCTESYSFDLPSNYGTTAYLVEFSITKVEVYLATDTDKTDCKAEFVSGETFCGDYYIYAVETGNATLDVTYDTETDKYLGAITHTSNNCASLYSGQTYDVTIAGSVVASGLGSTTFTLDGALVNRLISANGGQKVAYTVTISDAVYKNGDKLIVAYTGKTCDGTVVLPLVINTAPTAVTVDTSAKKATITNIPFVTEYAWRITANGSTEDKISGTVGVGDAGAISTTFELTNFASLTAGAYTIYVKAMTDESKKIYVISDAEASQDFVRTVVMSSVENATFTTKGNNKGDFETVLSWEYTQGVSKSNFVINFVSVATGATVQVDMSSLEDGDFVNNGTGYAVKFNGLDLKNSTDLGYDVTRTLPAGDYKITIQVVGDNEYYTDSAVVELGEIYQNKFGVVAVDADAFAVAPECFYGSTDEVDEESLSAYVSKYGFNTKYLVITENGATQNKATSFKITINGTDFGIVNKTNGVAELSFASVDSAEKHNIGSVWRVGENVISIMPYASSDLLSYYYYVSGVEAYALTTTTAQTALTTTATIEMYKKFSTPSDPRVELGYSDSAKHNINKVNVSFANSTSDMTYTVKVMYKDYYHNDNVCEFGTFTKTAKFNGAINLGFDMYDEIKAIGPHEIWFEVTQTGVKLDDATLAKYYINSDVATTTPFVYTTALPEFGGQAVSGVDTCVVTAIDYENAGTYQNGTLMWTLPKQAYSMVAEYVVTLTDKYGSSATKTARVQVTVGNTTTYDLIQNDSDLFSINNETNCLTFDMSPFFRSEYGTRLNNYIAGEYKYQITAKAYDYNGVRVENRIFDPATTTFSGEFTYKGIEYPLAPSEVKVDAEGILSWEYDISKDKYSNETTRKFVVTVQTYTLTGSWIEEKEFTTTEIRDIDINGYLVAGGSVTNKVYVRRVSPNDLYLDSKRVEASFESEILYKNMPEITASWTEQNVINYSITGSVDALNSELTANNYSATFKLSLLRVSQSDAQTLSGANYDSVLTSGVEYKQIDFNLGNFDGSTLSYQLNLIDAIKSQNKAGEWLNGANLIAGSYFAKIEFISTHPYLNSSKAYITCDAKSVWAVVDESELAGEYLTTKSKDTTTATPINGDDRNWANASEREAVLSFNVYAIKDFNSVSHLPESVTVRVTLRDNSGDEVARSKTYYLPKLSDMTGATLTGEDCLIARVGEQTDYYLVGIDIHELFDDQKVAGAYAVEYILNEDSVGSASQANREDGSSWYMCLQDICHYLAIATPVLDYRLDMIETDTGYTYQLNWALSPNQNTYKVEDEIPYNLNIFAFKQNSSGVYGCDNVYNSLSKPNQQIFLQKETANSNQPSSYGFVLGQLVRDFDTIYTQDDRRCYINYNGSRGIVLEPNNSYKFFMYLSYNASGNNAVNAQYYLNSLTSAPQEYVYKAISAQHYGAEITASVDNVYVVENQEDYLNAKVYDLISNQDSNNYNNGFELFIYDTQDATAGTSDDWMKNQEANKTYLAHYIITTLANVASTGNKAPLYVVNGDAYVDGKNVPLDYLTNADGSLRQIGVLENSTIKVDGFTLGELLGENRAMTPITYYCKIKSWINNNDVNAGAFTATDGTLSPVTLYGEEWLREYVTTTDTDIAKYLFALEAQGVQKTVGLADFNSLNPSYYFTFQHIVQFAEPQISEIQLVNFDGEDDVKGESKVNASQDGAVTSGYIKADSDGNYMFKIYLDNVASDDVAYTQDKRIMLSVATHNYGSTGIIDFTDDSSLTAYRSATLVIYKDSGGSYVILSKTSSEAGASALFSWIDEQLPNKVYFKATAVMDASDQNRATGGDNTANAFIPATQDANKTKAGYGAISRVFASSSTSESLSLIIKKQYSAPIISLRFDDTTSTSLVDTSSTKTMNGLVTNVLNGGEYDGMALNTYLYVSGDDYASIGAQGASSTSAGFEYVGLSNRANTYYEITFGYNGQTKTCQFSTKDINATLSAFSQAVSKSSARFNYSTNKAVYPYESACLYETLYNWIKGLNGNSYRGGVISMSIQVVASADSEQAGYWVSSDTRECDDFGFYVRLETVKTSFNPNDATFEEDAKYIATMSSYYEGLDYYYQSVIPLKYYTISKNAKYRVILTRPNIESSGNLVYSYDEFKSSSLTNAQKCEWTPTQTGENWGNLTDILAIDRYNTLSDANVDLNQWLNEYAWNIQLFAYVDSANDEFITRGFSSETMQYTPKLKVVNDITNIQINTAVDSTTGVVDSIDIDDIVVTTTTNATNNRGFNGAGTKAIFTYTIGSQQYEKEIEILQKVGKICYPAMVRSFIDSVFINNEDMEIMGGKYAFKVRMTNELDNVVASDDSDEFTFVFYKQIDASYLSATVTQASTSNNYFTIKASVAQNLTINDVKVKLAQTLLNTSTQVLSNEKSTTRSSSNGEYVFSATWSFSKNYADCFSTSTFTATEAKNLTENGYVTSVNKGNIQAGYNTFYLYPKVTSSSVYNVLKKDSYVAVRAKFVVPSSYNPTITLSYDTSEEGGETELGEKYKDGIYYYADLYKTAYYKYVTKLTASVSNGAGYSVNASWKYGWKKNSSETSCTKTEFNKSSSSTNLSTISSITLASGANYAKFTVTLIVKSGFENYFVNTSVKRELNVDLSSEHTERVLLTKKFAHYISG